MIKHVVCYRLYERTEEKKQEVKEMFMSMKDKIEYIKEISVKSCTTKTINIIVCKGALPLMDNIRGWLCKM